MPRAYDAVAVEYPFHERSAIVRAARADRVIPPVEASQQDLCTVNRNLLHLAVSEFIGFRNRYFFVCHEMLTW